MKKAFTLIILACLLGSAGIVSAQKIAFVNSSIILQAMPEVKQAESSLEVLKTQLQKAYQNDVTKWQGKVQELQRKEKQGELSPKALQDEAKLLEDEQQTILQKEQDMMSQLQAKETELLQPILDRVNEAINGLAESEGYSAVFDATPALLYVNPEIDITEKVKAQLGL